MQNVYEQQLRHDREDRILTNSQDRLNQNASQAVTKVRQLLVDEHVEEAEKLADLGLVSTPQSQRFYQTLGNIEIYFDGGLDSYTNGSYQRWLDLDKD